MSKGENMPSDTQKPALRQKIADILTAALDPIPPEPGFERLVTQAHTVVANQIRVKKNEFAPSEEEQREAINILKEAILSSYSKSTWDEVISELFTLANDAVAQAPRRQALKQVVKELDEIHGRIATHEVPSR
jgi:hypothetical protein